MSAPTVLACGYGKPGDKSPVCHEEPAAIGSGPSLNQAGTAAVVTGGFVQGRELVFTFGHVFETTKLPLQGAVWSVNLDTGARRIISGFSNDAASGPRRTGSGPDFGIAYDVKPGPAGSLWVYSRLNQGEGKASSSDMLLTKVAPDGTRTRVLNLSQLPPPCPHVLNNLAVGPDGALYAPFSHLGVGRGIVKIDPTARTCTPVTQSPLDGKAAVGQGPQNTTLSAVLFHQGSLYATDFIKQALFKIAPANGDRTCVSSSNGSGIVGGGPKALGTGWMTAEGNTLWVSGAVVGNDASNSLPPGVVEVNLATGERKRFPSGEGPQIPGSDDTVRIWKEPGSNSLVVAARKGFLRYQLGGDRNWFSLSP